MRIRWKTFLAVPILLFAATATAQSGFVDFVSNPNGVRIYINGELKGQTPLTLELRYGTYSIQARKAGFSHQTQSLEVRKPVQKLNFDLVTPPPEMQKEDASTTVTRDVGRLLVASDSPGQEVLLNGQPPIKGRDSVTTLSLVNVPTGSYSIKVGNVNGSVTIYKGLQTVVRLTNGKLLVTDPKREQEAKEQEKRLDYEYRERQKKLLLSKIIGQYELMEGHVWYPNGLLNSNRARNVLETNYGDHVAIEFKTNPPGSAFPVSMRAKIEDLGWTTWGIGKWLEPRASNDFSIVFEYEYQYKNQFTGIDGRQVPTKNRYRTELSRIQFRSPIRIYVQEIGNRGKFERYTPAKRADTLEDLPSLTESEFAWLRGKPNS